TEPHSAREDVEVRFHLRFLAISFGSFGPFDRSCRRHTGWATARATLPSHHAPRGQNLFKASPATANGHGDRPLPVVATLLALVDDGSPPRAPVCGVCEHNARA